MMISSDASLPFLLHFGERIPKRPAPSFRYDARRSVSQVFVGCQWVDALDVQQTEIEGVTKLTEVGKETTDDE